LKFRIFVASRSFGKIVDDGLKLLEREAIIEDNPYGRTLTEEELERHLQDADAVVLGADKCTAKVLSSAQKLKVIGRHGIGVDNVDLKVATDRGVVVTYTPSINVDSVAEHTFGLILALVRKIPAASVSTKAGKWEGLRFVGTELVGKTIGIIGLGNIGLGVAKRAKAFGMRVIYYDIELKRNVDVTYVPLDQLLKESDVISIHAALTPEARGMIGAKELALMKKGSFLVNAARGGIVDEKELIKALAEGRIAGAALDVLEMEPPDSNNPLFKMDNVIVTPHIAAYTLEAIRRMDLTVAEDIMKVLRGKKPKHIANPEVLKSVSLSLT